MWHAFLGQFLFTRGRIGHLHHRGHRRTLRTGENLRIGILRLQRGDMLWAKRGDKVNFPSFKRGHLGHRVFDDADDDAVHIRLASLVIFFPAIHDKMVIGHPFNKLEGATADHCARSSFFALIEVVFRRCRWRVDHEPSAIACHHVQEKSIRALHMYPHRARVDDFDAVNRLIKPPHPRFGRRVHQAVYAELDGFCIQLRVVVEIDIIPQLKRIRFAVRRDLPRVRRITDKITIWGDVHQAAANIHRHHDELIARGSVEIKVGDFVAVGDTQRTTALGLGRQGHSPREQTESHQNRDQLKPSMHTFLLRTCYKRFVALRTPPTKKRSQTPR